MTEPDVTETDESADTDDASDIDAEREPDPGTDSESEGADTRTDTEDGSAGVADDTEEIAELTERVATASDEQIAREIANLRSLVADLDEREPERGAEAESESDSEVGGSSDAERIEELESKLARKQADFENFKQRMNRRREQERERATEDLVTRLLGVRDDLVRALAQDADAEIRGGVESTLEEFDRVLDDEGVSEISPEPGTEIDPQRHEVMMRVDSEHAEGTIAEVFRSGYEMGGKILRPTQVTVSDGDVAGDGGSGDGDTDSSDGG